MAAIQKPDTQNMQTNRVQCHVSQDDDIEAKLLSNAREGVPLVSIEFYNACVMLRSCMYLEGKKSLHARLGRITHYKMKRPFQTKDGLNEKLSLVKRQRFWLWSYRFRALALHFEDIAV